MRNIKICLRTLMYKDRFSNAFIMYIEKDISRSLKNEHKLNKFAMSYHHLLVIKCSNLCMLFFFYSYN